MRLIPLGLAIALGLLCPNAFGQTTPPAPAGSAVATPDTAMLLTIFLKHDQSRPLADLNAQLAKQGFYKAFPPPGTEVVSWDVAMGIGRPDHRAALSGVAPARGQPRAGGHRLGTVPHRVLSDLRLQGGRPRGARQGALTATRCYRNFTKTFKVSL